jgi:hypothetical protein
MANCEFCGDWAGLIARSHPRCFDSFKAGASLDQIKAERKSVTAPSVSPTVAVVRTPTIVWGVFLGMWLFAITAGIVCAIIASFR